MRYRVDKAETDTLLVRFIKKRFEVDRKILVDIIEEGSIKINNYIVHRGTRVYEGDMVEVLVELGEEKKSYELSEDEKKLIEESIVYEDDDILLFNKKSKYLVHKANEGSIGLVDMLRSYTGSINFAFVNRIDRDTSGIILGAKSLKALRELSREIEEKRIKKYYYILVEGVIEEDYFEIHNYLAKGSRKVRVVDEKNPEGKLSISKFWVVKRGQGRSILRAELITGRTHQLRVQLSHRSNPIVGDAKYGREKGQELCLFSHKVVIPIYQKDISLEIPREFEERLANIAIKREN